MLLEKNESCTFFQDGFKWGVCYTVKHILGLPHSALQWSTYWDCYTAWSRVGWVRHQMTHYTAPSKSRFGTNTASYCCPYTAFCGIVSDWILGKVVHQCTLGTKARPLSTRCKTWSAKQKLPPSGVNSANCITTTEIYLFAEGTLTAAVI